MPSKSQNTQHQVGDLNLVLFVHTSLNDPVWIVDQRTEVTGSNMNQPRVYNFLGTVSPVNLSIYHDSSVALKNWCVLVAKFSIFLNSSNAWKMIGTTQIWMDSDFKNKEVPKGFSFPRNPKKSQEITIHPPWFSGSPGSPACANWASIQQGTSQAHGCVPTFPARRQREGGDGFGEIYSMAISGTQIGGTYHI